MIDEQPRRGSSCLLQGCLFGAVALFAVLLIVMLFLAYTRFIEHTADPDTTAAAEVSPGGPPIDGWFTEAGVLPRG